MPPVKRAARGVSDADDEDEDYRRGRERNNEAVRRSRNKAKQRTQETFTRVSKLKAENQILEDKVRILTQELEFHKKLFMELPSNAQDPRLEGIDLEKVFEDIPDNKDEKT
ncbi:CCAAT/enhancer-binding protein gamma-like [Choristoneura fumiferana]|uniref:CCAAT/enhancer-binding protein gamma-like n=1 Tax=Choristoneura fumiferana TaxID=7141 RepID=UPI003D15CAE2